MIEINWNPSRKELRVFAVLWMLFFCLVAGLIYVKTGSAVLSMAIGLIALIIDLIGLCLPGFLRRVYLVWMVAVFPIGWILSHVAIATVYYGVITPTGLIMRLLGRDALNCAWDPSEDTYWQPRRDPDDAERYFRQF